MLVCFGGETEQFEVEAKTVTTQGLLVKAKGEETSTYQFPEGTPLAKTSKVTLQDSFPTFLEISWP